MQKELNVFFYNYFKFFYLYNVELAKKESYIFHEILKNMNNSISEIENIEIKEKLQNIIFDLESAVNINENIENLKFSNLDFLKELKIITF